MINENQPIESLLSDLSLSEPQETLDQKMSELFSSPEFRDFDSVAAVGTTAVASSENGSNARFCPVFLCTTLGTLLAGFVLGQIVDVGRLDRWSSQGVMATRDSQASRERSSLTSVKFNFSAFDLLHGHSQSEPSDSCKQCHVGPNDETAQWFHGWFYGNLEFFEKHVGGNMTKCSNCHQVIELKYDGREPDEPTGNPHDVPEHDKRGNCLDCHV